MEIILLNFLDLDRDIGHQQRQLSNELLTGPVVSYQTIFHLMPECLDTVWCLAIGAWIMSPMTTKNSTGNNMQPCLTPLPTTKGAERVPLCSTRHLAPLYVDLMTDTNLFFSVPSRGPSIHDVKGLFKVYKSPMQIGTIFSTLLDHYPQSVIVVNACSRSIVE